jgi:branched-chain amino acid aminotransferase
MPELSDGFFLQALHELIHLDQEWVPNTQDSSLYIRPFMFASDEFIGLRPSENYQFLIFTSPVGKYYTEPVKVKVESYYTRAAEGGTGFAKTSANYAAAMYPARLAQEEGFHQLLWTDGKQHRFVEESGTMNVLFVINGKLVSIPPSETILAGIMRKSVLELARDWGLEVEERPVEVAELVKGIKDGSVQEMFGAGTAATITHISHVGHNGEVLALPPVEKREISNKIFAELTGIQRGTIADRFGWMYKIPKK